MKQSLFVFMLSMSAFLIAQKDTTRQKEVGLIFSNLNNFGFTYKIGKSTSLWRFNTVMISGNSSEKKVDSNLRTNGRFGFGLSFGKEFRKEIDQNLELRYGLDLFSSLDKYYFEDDYTYDNGTSTSERKSITLDSGLRVVIGINYVHKDKLVLGAELLPSFSYLSSKNIQKLTENDETETEVTKQSGFNYGLSNSSARLSIAYRF